VLSGRRLLTFERIFCFRQQSIDPNKEVASICETSLKFCWTTRCSLRGAILQETVILLAALRTCSHTRLKFYITVTENSAHTLRALDAFFHSCRPLPKTIFRLIRSSFLPKFFYNISRAVQRDYKR
jgi:hypothetical protein